MGVRKSVVLIITGFAAASAVFAVPGDIISRFGLSGNIYPVATAMYRDATYAYGVYDGGPSEEGQLWRYTPAGTRISTLILSEASRPIDAGHSQLGAGYLTVLDGGTSLKTYAVATGSLVGSTPVTGFDGYAYNPVSGYYYASINDYVHRFTKAGSLVGSFNAGPQAGTLAASPRFAGKDGDYVIVHCKDQGVHPTVVYTGNGSIVDSFIISGPWPTMDRRHGAIVGEGYPASYGITLWFVLQTDFIWRSAYQVDLGNSNPVVSPASFGAVKALFR